MYIKIVHHLMPFGVPNSSLALAIQDLVGQNVAASLAKGDAGPRPRLSAQALGQVHRLATPVKCEVRALGWTDQYDDSGGYQADGRGAQSRGQPMVTTDAPQESPE